VLLRAPVTILLAAALALAGCSEETTASGQDIPARCGLPTPDPRVDASVVADAFLLGGDAEVTKTQESKRGTIAALNVPLSVSEAFSRYSESVRQGGYEVVDDDFEGFEAELYLRKGKDLGAVQIRRSTCDDASIVFVHVVKEAAATFPSPSQSG
jgi:hypothetical protein